VNRGAVNIINDLLQGALLGGYYSIIACGLSFMVGVMKIINLAHGSLAVAVAFVLLLIANSSGLNPFLALIAISPAIAAVGWLLQRCILERSLRAGPLVPILSTFGLSIVIDNVLFAYFGPDTRSLAPYIGALSYDSWSLTDELYVGKLAVLILAVAILLIGGLQLFLKHTHLGRSIRAIAEDADTAELVGVNSRSINALAAAIALMTVGLAGMFMAMRATFDTYSGPLQLIFAFEASTIGGVASLWGTLAGGMILGIAQTLGAEVHPQGFLIGGHSVFLVILFARLYVSGTNPVWLFKNFVGWRA
jgi:branched-chain amino acid transport system permease protein